MRLCRTVNPASSEANARYFPCSPAFLCERVADDLAQTHLAFGGFLGGEMLNTVDQVVMRG
jgi:hypothetical protein